MSPDVSFVLPCHNEVTALTEVLARLEAVILDLESGGTTTELIIVDDGSTDGSLELLLKHPHARVVSLKNRVGYGAALKYGFTLARGKWISFFDLDRTYHPEDFPRLYERATATNADAVMGCRTFSTLDMPWPRTLGNRLFVALCRVLFGSPIEDMCTGFRILHRDRLDQVANLECEGFNFSIQLTLFSLLRGWRLEQVPISYEQRLGESKLKIFRDGFQFLCVILRYRCQRLHPF